MNRGTAQEEVVCDHFTQASSGWGARYDRRPLRMSDLDLQLRRANVHALLRPLIASDTPPTSLLDVGCGSGNLFEGLPTERMDITGVDLVPEMVAAAARRYPSRRFMVADITSLPFDPGSLDVITCLGVLEYLSDQAAALANMHRCLKPGGHLIVSFPNRVSLFRLLSRLESRADGFLVALVRRLQGREYVKGDRPKYAHQRLAPRATRRLLTENGFEVCDVMFNTYGMWGRSGRNRAALGLSKWMSRRFRRWSPISTSLACTMVFTARKRK